MGIGAYRLELRERLATAAALITTLSKTRDGDRRKKGLKIFTQARLVFIDKIGFTAMITEARMSYGDPVAGAMHTTLSRGSATTVSLPGESVFLRFRDCDGHRLLPVAS